MVLDNAKIHHSHVITELLERHMVPHIFLPPYSPDYMPIGLAFARLKQELKSGKYNSCSMSTAIQCAIQCLSKVVLFNNAKHCFRKWIRDANLMCCLFGYFLLGFFGSTKMLKVPRSFIFRMSKFKLSNLFFNIEMGQPCNFTYNIYKTS